MVRNPNWPILMNTSQGELAGFNTWNGKKLSNSNAWLLLSFFVHKILHFHKQLIIFFCGAASFRNSFIYEGPAGLSNYPLLKLHRFPHLRVARENWSICVKMGPFVWRAEGIHCLVKRQTILIGFPSSQCKPIRSSRWYSLAQFWSENYGGICPEISGMIPWKKKSWSLTNLRDKREKWCS